MKFELKKKLVAKSVKVKSVDFHQNYPWVLIGLFSGSIMIYDYNTQASLQYLEITPSPIRCVKFVPEKNWFICGADDKKVRIYNYNTMEKVKEYEAHKDFIRGIAVHPKLPVFLTCSDDQTVCQWDMEKNFNLIRTYDEHKNFVMKIAINSKDYNMFASASMDSKIKIWSFSGSNSHLTLEGHLKGATAVAFCPMNDKPYLASGSDDKTIKIWDYTNKNCIFTFEGHEENISALCFHPELPILISSAEDSSCKFWNVNTFKLEDTRLFGYEVIWDIASQESQNMIALGCEEGTLVVKMGSDQPLATFNNASQNAKIIFAKQNGIYSLNLKNIQNETKDGEVIDIQPKSLGNTELLFPLAIKFAPNGRHFAVISEKEFVISTSGVYRSNCLGNCSDFAWNDTSDFLVKDGNFAKLYKNMKEFKSFKPGFGFDSIFGGPFFALKTSDSIYIYDFETTVLLRKIDVTPHSIVWNENKKTVALICDDVTYILKVYPEKIEKFVEEYEPNEKDSDQEGCTDGFEPNFEINDKITNGLFVDDIFIFLNIKNKINYAIEDRVFSITTLNSNYYLQGYLPSLNKIYLMNKNYQLISYTFPQSFVNYQMAILKKNFSLAETIFSTIPTDYLDKVTNFLEKFELFELSYSICQNPNQRFSLAIKLKKLKDARYLAEEHNTAEKWKMVADLAFELGEFKHAEEAMIASKDYQGLLLYYSLINDREKILILAHNSENDGFYNIAFSCFFQLNEVEKCLQILLKSSKYPEASLFCRTYLPSRLAAVLELWNEEINNEEVNNRINIKVINPMEHFDEGKLHKIENVVQQYYDLVKNSSIETDEKLKEFNEFDLETYLNQSDNVDIDLLSILELNSK